VINKVQSFVEAIRPYNMMSGVLLFNIGFFLATYKINMDYFVGIAVIILAFAYATLQNDIEDVAIDRINAPNSIIASEKLNFEEVSNFNTVLLIGLLILSLYDFPRHLIPVLLIIIIIWSYNKPPLLLSRKPISSIVVLALMYSTIPLYYGYYLEGGLVTNHYLFYLIIAWFFVRISISILKDYKDARGDKIYNKKTFYLTFGDRATALVSIICGLIGYLGILIITFLITKSFWLLILLIPLTLWTLYLRFTLFSTEDVKILSQTFHRIFFGQNPLDLIFLICLILLK